MHKYLLLFLLMLVCGKLFSQLPSQFNNLSSGRGGGKSTDSIHFEHRDDAKDSVNISFRNLDSIRPIRFDTSIHDFYKYFIVPAYQQYLGNDGAAGYPLVFSPYAKAGWDAGFHAYDTYKYTLENSRFFKTTKPFTQLIYQGFPAKEQVIKIMHTQNPKPNLNFGMEFKLINSPGFLAYQNTNHSNLRFFGSYQGKRKRYGSYFLLFTNKIRGAENGGIQSDTFLTSKNFSRRYTIPVNLGGEASYDPSVFNPKFNTGTTQKDFTFFYRHYYDIGKKDSVEINDSTTEYLFYPKLRFQHTFTYSTSSYQFKDFLPDSALYQNWYDTTLNQNDTLLVTDSWKMVRNDFSLLQFPDTKNSGQYLLAGARLENIKGTFSSGSKNFYNIVLHGEYRNKTKNKLWDIIAKGELYMAGLNSGDYNIYASLSRYLNKRWGNVTLLFNNVNRSPSFIYNTSSSFNFENTVSYNKENIITLKATAENPFISLSATNYLITNYLFFTNYHKTDQYSKVINLLQLSAAKKIRLTRRWNWYIEATVQQTDAAAPINLPVVYTRNRIAYEGLFFKNFNVSTGFEIRYYTPYKAYNYSPVMGQFMPQDTVTIRNRPDINAFMNFRIKTFTGYLRAENLNTINFTNGFGFTHNNFAAPSYIYPGLIVRFGIQWNFVN